MNANDANITFDKNNLLKNKLTIHFQPVKLLNKVGTNMCWWNSFAQLFTSTRNMSILNTMYKFIKSHDCDNSNECWYCNILNGFYYNNDQHK